MYATSSAHVAKDISLGCSKLAGAWWVRRCVEKKKGPGLQSITKGTQWPPNKHLSVVPVIKIMVLNLLLGLVGSP